MSTKQLEYTATRNRVRVTYGSQRPKPLAPRAACTPYHAAAETPPSTPGLSSDTSVMPFSDPLSDAASSSDEHEDGTKPKSTLLAESLSKEGVGHALADKASRKENMTAKPKRRMTQTTLFGLASPADKRVRCNGHKANGTGIEGLFPELSTASTTPARRYAHPGRKTQAEPSTKEQTFLDFGQRLIAPKPCPQCNMTYQQGRGEDELLHKKFHSAWRRRQTGLLAWNAGASRNDGNVAATVAYPRIPAATKGAGTESAAGGMATIRLIDCQTSPKREIQRSLDILNIANEHLGAVKLGLADLEKRQRKVLLYISPKEQVEGCILAEMARNAQRVVSTRGAPEGTASAGANVECSEELCPALCGISRIWVAPHARRHGIASQMIQAVRKRFIYGCEIDLASIAFTQPTSDGRAFAEHIFKRKDFLVYVDDE
ncbi:hypothetical protein GGI12_001398 [Dipsacomyces acuminosporus]|nr:hypothetical protein GGI12_001398 [Dipsacomyces acuminosporus]